MSDPSAPSALLVQAAPGLLVIAALLVVGVVLGRRTGAGRSRVWAGLGLLIATQCATQAYALMVPLVAAEVGLRSVAAVNAVVNLVGGALFVTAVVLLVSGAVRARGSATPPAYGAAGPGSAPVPGPPSASSPYLGR